MVDFLIDYLCVINGRTGENDFTNINGNRSSIVDYIIVPHEQLERYKDFKVHTMSSLINRSTCRATIEAQNTLYFKYHCKLKASRTCNFPRIVRE